MSDDSGTEECGRCDARFCGMTMLPGQACLKNARSGCINSLKPCMADMSPAQRSGYAEFHNQMGGSTAKADEFDREEHLAAQAKFFGTKDTNPKDAVGTQKWRISSTVPMPVFWEVGVAMLEGARKYGRHNYRVAGVRTSVYVDAAKGHIDQYWEGEDIDADSGLSHITKAIATLVVLRDAMMRGMATDDRPPKSDVAGIRDRLQGVVDEIFRKYPDALPAFTEEGTRVVDNARKQGPDKPSLADLAREADPKKPLPHL